jgi:hypothetical protein
MPIPGKCSKCDKQTHRTQKIGNYRTIYLCQDHSEQIEKDREVLSKNKQSVTKYYLDNLNTPALKNIVELMMKVSKVIPTREVMQQYASGNEVRELTEEELKTEYDKFKAEKERVKSQRESK